MITNQNYTAHANPLFKKLKLLTINDIHKLKVAKYMFKTIQLHSGTTLSLFTPLLSLRNYHSRNFTTNFFIKRSNTELSKKSKQILGARVWLEAEVKSLRTSLASRTSSRIHFKDLGLERQVLDIGLGLEASSPRKLACPRLEDSTIF